MCQESILITLTESEIKNTPNYHDLGDLVMTKYWNAVNDKTKSTNCTCENKCNKSQSLTSVKTKTK